LADVVDKLPKSNENESGILNLEDCVTQEKLSISIVMVFNHRKS